jgi:ferredoxin, 2Fe-2S
MGPDGPVRAVKIIVDRNACVGHARCHHVTPALYPIDDDGYTAATTFAVPPGQEALARRGANACPERALRVEEESAAASQDSPTLVFIEHNGTVHRVQAKLGQSVMQAALDAAVPGILADCGGACSCGTCHAYIEGPAAGHLLTASDSEREMVDCVIDPQNCSRLTCQLPITTALDGLVVRLPRSQI